MGLEPVKGWTVGQNTPQLDQRDQPQHFSASVYLNKTEMARFQITKEPKPAHTHTPTPVHTFNSFQRPQQGNNKQPYPPLRSLPPLIEALASPLQKAEVLCASCVCDDDFRPAANQEQHEAALPGGLQWCGWSRAGQVCGSERTSANIPVRKHSVTEPGLL